MIVTPSKIETVKFTPRWNIVHSGKIVCFNRIGFSQSKPATNNTRERTDTLIFQSKDFFFFFFRFFFFYLFFKVEEKHRWMCQRIFCLQLIPASSFLQQKSKEKTNQRNYKLQKQCQKRRKNLCKRLMAKTMQKIR